MSNDVTADVKQILVENLAAIGNPDPAIIKLNEVTESPDTIIVISGYAGRGVNNIGSSAMPGVQIKVRAPLYVDANDQIQSIFSLLNSIGNELDTDFPQGYTANGSFYSKFEAVQYPSKLGGNDAKGRRTMVVNFIATKYIG